MRPTTLVSAALMVARLVVSSRATPANNGARLEARDDDEYWRTVCYPADYTEAAVPPCFSIDNIEAACQPNGTSKLAYEAHAQCMCGGSFFSEWVGCQNCLFVHGQRSERDMKQYSAVMTAASRALCTGTPTAAWAVLFSQAQETVPPPATGATALRDVKSGDTAVSLYYTATGRQGPGAVTGSATAATGTASGAAETTPTQSSTPTRTNASSRPTPDDSEFPSPTSASPTPSSSGAKPADTNAAIPVGVAGGKGLWLAVAGGVLVAAL